MLGNEKFDKSAILAAHRAATIRRMAGHPVILAVQGAGYDIGYV
jgi:hypothetical protein